MDVFYYWKDYAEDVKNARIGQFRSSKERLSELQAGFPNYIWVFKTPKGKKGQLQLLARLVWSDKPLRPVAAAPTDSYMYYDPAHAQSIWFNDSDSDVGVTAISNWVYRHFPSAVTSNFQGTNGQHAMRANVISELTSLSKNFDTQQFGIAQPLCRP